jgi:hypothetical protein
MVVGDQHVGLRRLVPRTSHSGSSQRKQSHTFERWITRNQAGRSLDT